MLEKFHMPCFSFLSLLSFLSSFHLPSFSPSSSPRAPLIFSLPLWHYKLELKTRKPGSGNTGCSKVFFCTSGSRQSALNNFDICLQSWGLASQLQTNSSNEPVAISSTTEVRNLFTKPDPWLTKPGRKWMGNDYHLQLMLIRQRNQPPSSQACASSTGRCLSFSQWCLYQCSLLLCYWGQR